MAAGLDGRRGDDPPGLGYRAGGRDSERVANDHPHIDAEHSKQRDETGSFFGACFYSRASMATASRSRSTYGSPLTSTATRLIVPPVK
jgi:hypothetical protein